MLDHAEEERPTSSLAPPQKSAMCRFECPPRVGLVDCVPTFRLVPFHPSRPPLHLPPSHLCHECVGLCVFHCDVLCVNTLFPCLQTNSHDVCNAPLWASSTSSPSSSSSQEPTAQISSSSTLNVGAPASVVCGSSQLLVTALPTQPRRGTDTHLGFKATRLQADAECSLQLASALCQVALLVRLAVSTSHNHLNRQWWQYPNDQVTNTKLEHVAC